MLTKKQEKGILDNAPEGATQYNITNGDEGVCYYKDLVTNGYMWWYLGNWHKGRGLPYNATYPLADLRKKQGKTHSPPIIHTSSPSNDPSRTASEKSKKTIKGSALR